MKTHYTYYVTCDDKTTGYDYKEFENYCRSSNIFNKITDEEFCEVYFDYARFYKTVVKLRDSISVFLTENNIRIEAKKDR